MTTNISWHEQQLLPKERYGMVINRMFGFPPAIHLTMDGDKITISHFSLDSFTSMLRSSIFRAEHKLPPHIEHILHAAAWECVNWYRLEKEQTSFDYAVSLSEIELDRFRSASMRFPRIFQVTKIQSTELIKDLFGAEDRLVACCEGEPIGLFHFHVVPKHAALVHGKHFPIRSERILKFIGLLTTLCETEFHRFDLSKETLCAAFELGYLLQTALSIRLIRIHEDDERVAKALVKSAHLPSRVLEHL